MNPSLTTIQLISVAILPLIFAITVHEACHGLIAYWLGDKTPRILGRLTLNPIKHIDLIGTIILPLATFFLSHFVIGWAKPVQINSRNLSKPKRDMALIAAAGPMSNFLMAFIWAAIAKLGMVLYHLSLPGAPAVFYMGIYGIQINLMLMLLNLLPVPPLDGGRILSGLLPQKASIIFDRIFAHGFLILLVLLAFGVINLVINPGVDFLFNLIRGIFGV